MPSHSWVDEGHLAALLERLRQPPATVAPRAPLTSAPPTLAPPTAPLPALPAAQPLASARPFHSEQRSLDGRLADLLDWIEERWQPQAVFLADQDGLSLAQRGDESFLPLAATTLLNSWRTSARTLDLPLDPVLEIGLPNDQRLVVLTGESPWGILTLGLCPTRSLEATAAAELRRALGVAIEEPRT